MLNCGTLFICPSCKKESSAELWNEATISEYGEPIKKIDENPVGDYDYLCPICKIENDVQSVRKIHKGDVVC